MRIAVRTLAVVLALFFAVTVPACRMAPKASDDAAHERHDTGPGSQSHAFRE